MKDFEIIRGEVIHGKKLGRKIGFPTANLDIGTDHTIEDASYFINAKIAGKVYRGMGVYRKEIHLFEGHFFGLDADIYGQIIEICVYKKLRDNIKFSSLDEVKLQLGEDKKIIQNTICNVLTFGTFDRLHPGHEYYLNTAKMYGNALITIVATDNNREKLTGKKPRIAAELRKKNLQELEISDTIEIGSDDNHLIWLEKYKPYVICLGYDQVGFSSALEIIPNLTIKRIASYHPGKYKSSLIK